MCGENSHKGYYSDIILNFFLWCWISKLSLPTKPHPLPLTLFPLSPSPPSAPPPSFSCSSHFPQMSLFLLPHCLHAHLVKLWSLPQTVSNTPPPARTLKVCTFLCRSQLDKQSSREWFAASPCWKPSLWTLCLVQTRTRPRAQWTPRHAPHPATPCTCDRVPPVPPHSPPGTCTVKNIITKRAMS